MLWLGRNGGPEGTSRPVPVRGGPRARTPVPQWSLFPREAHVCAAATFRHQGTPECPHLLPEKRRSEVSFPQRNPQCQFSRRTRPRPVSSSTIFPKSPNFYLKPKDASVISKVVLAVFLNINPVFLASEVCWGGGEAKHNPEQSGGVGEQAWLKVALSIPEWGGGEGAAQRRPPGRQGWSAVLGSVSRAVRPLASQSSR